MTLYTVTFVSSGYALLSYFAAFPSVEGEVSTVLFLRGKLCDVAKKIQNNCMHFYRNDSSVTSCCVQCTNQTSCVGASLSSGMCHLHSKCGSDDKCSMENKSYLFCDRVSDSTKNGNNTSVNNIGITILI